MITVKTGIDLVEIKRLEDINPAIRFRFIGRVFTGLEIIEAGESIPSLSGRFAVKEAVVKALGTGIGPISWQEIEVRRSEFGEPELNLTGNALRIANEQGVNQWSLSISHTKCYAVAVVVALCDTSNCGQSH
jgi:holo-[acyl-carrier protein] synthase